MSEQKTIWKIEGSFIKEQPTIDNPKKKPHINIAAWNIYDEHIASLRSFPHDLPPDLEGKDLIEGEHFRLQYQVLILSKDGRGRFIDCIERDYNKRKPNRRRIIALPIESAQQPKVEEKENYQQSLSDLLEWFAMFHGALNELVELKEIKDKDGKTEDYLKRQPLAWNLAKECLRLWKDNGYKETHSPNKGEEAISVLNWLLDFKEPENELRDEDKIIITDGDFYWESDNDGSYPMDGKDIYNLFLEHKNRPK